MPSVNLSLFMRGIKESIALGLRVQRMHLWLGTPILYLSFAFVWGRGNVCGQHRTLLKVQETTFVMAPLCQSDRGF